MAKATNTPTKSTTTPAGNSKRGFWIPDTLYLRIQSYVSQHRNAPDDMTINKFVREALALKLQAVERRPLKKAVRA